MSLATDLNTIFAFAKGDLFAKAGPAVVTFLQAVAANPSALGFAGAQAALTGALLGSAPGLEQDVLKEVATILTNEVQAAIAAAQPKT